MKSTGVVRRIDELGRIVVPKEMRRVLRIREGDSLEISADTDAITLKKYSLVESIDNFIKGWQSFKRSQCFSIKRMFILIGL